MAGARVLFLEKGFEDANNDKLSFKALRDEMSPSNLYMLPVDFMLQH